MSIIEIVKKSGSADFEWDQASFLEVVFWCRFLFGIALGIAFGILEITGVQILFAFIALSAMTATTMIQRFGTPKGVVCDQADLMKEGLGESISAFVLFWTIVYTIQNPLGEVQVVEQVVEQMVEQ